MPIWSIQNFEEENWQRSWNFTGTATYAVFPTFAEVVSANNNTFSHLPGWFKLIYQSFKAKNNWKKKTTHNNVYRPFRFKENKNDKCQKSLRLFLIEWSVAGSVDIKITWMSNADII